MTNLHFYEILDKKIDNLINLFKDNKFLKKQTGNGRKSFGFLLWFLENYVPTKDLSELEDYITEGNDDSSCDLIFSNTDQKGDLIYYVVQAKWFEKSNISKTNEMAKEIKACLSDFRVVLSGKKTPSLTNLNFNIRYSEFIEHKRQNGKIKFLFVALCKGEENIQEHIDDFISELVSFELFDFFILKKHYIEFEYKEIKTHNPIETPYIPQGSYNMNIVCKKNFRVPSTFPHEAYIILVKPIEIFRLFEKYKFALFYKNIRNPLPNSFFNADIARTIKEDPLYFWYFNNGITAITDKIFPFHNDSEKLQLQGIQIINGAQTVFTIYETYKFASDSEKEKMDENALITLRLVKTGGTEFDLRVTRFTNSQNPINERDFHSNDEIQIKLQNDFFKHTNIWYETRRGEFRKRFKNAPIVSNELMAQTYLAYGLEDSFDAKNNKQLIFYSNKIFPDGLYEKVFNDDTHYLDMYISYHFLNVIEQRRKEFKKIIGAINITKKLSLVDKKNMKYSFLQYASFDILALMHFALFTINAEESKAINGKIKADIDKNNCKITRKYIEFITENLKSFIEKIDKNKQLVYSVFFKSKDSYTKMKEYLEQSIKKKKAQVKNLKL